MPCIRDIALSGRNALSVLIVLNAWIPPAPNRDAVKLINETFFERRKQERESGGKKELKEVSIHIHRGEEREAFIIQRFLEFKEDVLFRSMIEINVLF